LVRVPVKHDQRYNYVDFGACCSWREFAHRSRGRDFDRRQFSDDRQFDFNHHAIGLLIAWLLLYPNLQAKMR
jgi:hypothetical protein